MLQVAYIAVELLIALVVYWTFRKTIRLGEKHILTVSRFLFCFLYLGIPCLAHFGMNLLGGNLKKGFAEVLIAAFRGLSVGVCEELVFRGLSFNKLQKL